MSGAKYTKSGLPVDANDWTEADWLDLHRAIKRVIRKIAKRHRAARAETLSKKQPTESEKP